MSANGESNMTINQLLQAELDSAPSGTMNPKLFRQTYKNKPLRYVVVLTMMIAFSSPAFTWNGIQSDITADDLTLFDFCANQAFVIVLRCLPQNMVFRLSIYPAHMCVWAVEALLAEPAKLRRRTRLWTRKILMLEHGGDVSVNITRVRNALEDADYLLYPVGILGAVQLFFCMEYRGVAWQYQKMIDEEPGIRAGISNLPDWRTIFPLVPIRWGMLAVRTFHHLFMHLRS
jgi:hypothetical protein